MQDWSNLDLSDPENWPGVSFKIHVHAYSGIGPGAIFCVDFGSGMVEPVELSEESVDVEDLGDKEVDSIGDEGAEDIDDVAQHRWELLSDDGEDSESDGELDNDEDSMGEVAGLEGEGTWNEDSEKLFVKPPAENYDPETMVTRVQVTYHQPYGQIVGPKEVLKRRIKQKEEEHSVDGVADTETPSTVIAKSVVAKALAMAQTSISSGEVKIRSARSEMEEYELGVDWAQDLPDETLHRPQGWA